ncbi:S-layer homology domain-containing protein [Bacillus infantis]|uniref:S-layer homology domain-containing protein n=1 Tax=Bacillus infantis TaxID=324767 RepID=UPI003CE87650
MKNNRKKILAAAVTTSIVASAAANSVEAADFSDLKKGSFGYEEISNLVKAGVIDGFGDGTFRPGTAITRQQAAKLFTRALNLKAPSSGKGFKDVSPESAFYSSVLAVQEAGIFKGTGEYFNPNATLTREEMATALVRAFKLKSSGAQVPFKDLKEISPAHLENVKTLYQAGVTKGKAGFLFDPKGNVSRAEFSVFLFRQVIGEKAATIEKLADSKVYIDGKAYTYSKELKPFFSKENENALLGAGIKYNQDNSQITEITYLEINASGKEKQDNSGNVVLKGERGTVNGDMVINGDFITVEKLNIKGSLTITSKTANSFIGKSLSVEKSTVINGKAMAIFNDSKLNSLEAAAMGSRIELKGTTAVRSAEVLADAVLSSENTIPQLMVKGQAAKLELNGKVQKASFANEKPIHLKGAGEIEMLEASGAAITLENGLKIGDLHYSAASKVADVITNYNQVKGNIAKLNGKDNPDAAAAAPVNTGSPIPSDQTPPQGLTGLSAVSDHTKVTLSWNASSEADFSHYEIYYLAGKSVSRESAGAQKAIVKEKGSGRVSFDIASLSNDVDYAFAVYAVDSSGNYSTAATAAAAPAAEQAVSENIFENNRTYSRSYLINPAAGAVYGAPTTGNSSSVNGNVTLKGSAALQNLVISGTLILDPGDEGEVTLDNIEASAIKVLSGKVGTIVFNHVKADSVFVSDDNGIRLKSDGSSTIGSLRISPSNPTGASEVQLAGNYNNTNIILEKDVTVTAKPDFSAGGITIEGQENLHIILQAEEGSAADFPSVTFKSPAKLSSGAGSISIPKIILANGGMTAGETEINGSFGQPEVLAEKAVSLKVEAEISKLTAKSAVHLSGGKAGAIQNFETIGNAGKIQGATEEVNEDLKKVRDTSVNLAKAEIKKVLEQTEKDLASLQKADAYVVTAISLGAAKTDFIEGNKNLIDELNKLKTQLSAKMDAIKELNEKLAELPKKEYLPYITSAGLSKLKNDAAAAEAASDKAKAAGIANPEKDANVKNYSRLNDALQHIQKLEGVKEAVLEGVLAKLAELPEPDAITIGAIDEIIQQMEEAKRAAAEAELKGAVPSDFIRDGEDLLAKLNAVESAVSELLQAKAAAISMAVEKLAALPETDDITVGNLESVRKLANIARTAVEQAKIKGAADSDFALLSVLASVEAKIALLDDARISAIDAANKAIASLPEPDSITVEMIEALQSELNAVKTKVEAARQAGAENSGFVNLEKIDQIEERMAELFGKKAEAVELVNEMLQNLPDVSAITFANFKQVKADVSKLKQAIADAKEKGAAEADFEDIEKLLQADEKVLELENSSAEAITAANQAISALPAAEEIGTENLDEVKAKWQAAVEAIADARAKGAVDADFPELDRVDETERAIEMMETALEEVILTANEALGKIPAAKDITAQNFKEVKILAAAAKNAVAIARTKGAEDSDFTGLEKISSAEEKIAELEQQYTEAVSAANQAISNLPVPADISFSTLSEAKEKLENAESAIAEARAKGAEDADFANLGKLSEVKEKISSLEIEKKQSISEANAAIAGLPEAEQVTVSNFKEVKADAEAANIKLNAARQKGATDADFTGLSKLQAVLAKVIAFEHQLNEAILAANEAIALLPEPESITRDTLQSAKDQLQAAADAIEAARQKGAADSDFTGIEKLEAVETKIAEFGDLKEQAIESANEALAAIPNAEFITEENAAEVRSKVQIAQMLVAQARLLGAEDSDFTGQEKINQALAALKQFESGYDLEHYENPLESLAKINQNIDGFTAEDLMGASDSGVKEKELERYRAELKKVLSENNRDLTLGDVGLAVSRLNGVLIEEGIEAINSNLSGFTFEDLNKVQYVFGSFRIQDYRDALTAAYSKYGHLSSEEISNTIFSMEKEAALNAVNSHPESAEMMDLYTLAAEYGYHIINVPVEVIRTELKRVIAQEGPLTATEIVEIIKNLSTADIHEVFLEEINSNPEHFSTEALSAVSSTNLEYQLIDSYRKAIADYKASQSAPLSAKAISKLVADINDQAYLHEINTDRDYYYALSIVAIGDFAFKQLSEYQAALERKQNEKGDLTKEEVIAIVRAVNSDIRGSALAAINMNPEESTYFQLSDAVDHYGLVDSNALEFYRAALVEAVNISSGNLSEYDIRQLIEDVNSQLALAYINNNPETFTMDHLRKVLSSTWLDKELILDYRESVSLRLEELQAELTAVQLSEIVNQVNDRVSDAAVQYISDNIDSFEYAALVSASKGYNVWEEYLEEYRKELKALKERNGRALQYSEILSALSRVHQEMAQKEVAYTINLLMTEPKLINIDHLWRISPSADERLIFRYIDELSLLLDDGMVFTQQNIAEVINNINKTYAIETLNNTPFIISMRELGYIVEIHSFSEEFLDDYKQAFSDDIKASGPMSAGRVAEVILQVNKRKIIEQVNAYPEGLTINHLAALYGWNFIDQELLVGYIGRARAELDAGRELTFETLLSVIKDVNQQDQQEALAEINENPQGFSYSTLLRAADTYVKEERLSPYRMAIKMYMDSKGGHISAAELISILEDVNRQENERERQDAIDYINEYPAAFSIIDLRSSGIYIEPEYEHLLPEFRAAVGAKQLTKGRDLTFEEIFQTVNQILNEAKNLKEAAALERINENPEGASIWDIKLFFTNAREDRLEAYRAALLEKANSVGELNEWDVENAITEKNKALALAEINDHPASMTIEQLTDALFNENYSFKQEYLAEYRLKMAEAVEADGTITIEEIIEILEEVNGRETLPRIQSNPESIQASELRMILGSENVVDESIADYRTAITNAVHSGTQLTRDILLDLVLAVNSEVSERALTEINANPEAVTAELLRKAGVTVYAYPDRLQLYREAIAKKKAELEKDLSLTELEAVIEDVNANYRQYIEELVLKRIIENPDTFTIDDLNQLNIYPEYEDKIAEYRQKVKAELDRLTVDRIRQIVWAVDSAVRENAAAEMLNVIKSDPTGFSFKVLQQATRNLAISADRIDLYRKAVASFLDENNGQMGLYQLESLIMETDKAAAFKKAKEAPLSLTIIDVEYLVRDAGNWAISVQYLEGYRTSIKAEVDSGRELTSQRVVELINQVGREYGLAEIIRDGAGFKDQSLLHVVFPYYSWEFMDAYREAVIDLLETNQTLTIVLLNDLAAGINSAHFLNQITADPQSAEVDQLRLLLQEDDLVRSDYEYLELYRSTLVQLKAEKDEGELFTISEVKQAITKANAEIDGSRLDAINKNPEGFDINDLGKLIGYELINYSNLDFYQQSVAQMLAELERDLTAEEILEAVKLGNELADKANLDAINLNPDSFGLSDLEEVAGNINWSNLEYYREAIKAMLSVKGAPLTKEEIKQAVVEGDALAVEARLAEINGSPEKFESSILGELYGYDIVQWENMEWYRSALNEAIQSNNGEPLSYEEIRDILLQVNSAETNSILEKINSSPGEVTRDEIYSLLPDEIAHLVFDPYVSYYQDQFAEMKAEMGRDLRLEDVKTAVEDTNERIYEEIFDKITQNPQELQKYDLGIFEESYSENVYFSWEQFKLYQILFTEHLAAGGAPLSRDDIKIISEDVYANYNTIWSYILAKESYKSGDILDVATSDYQLSQVFLVPVSHGSEDITEQELYDLVESGVAVSAGPPNNGENTLIDTAGLPAGDYAVYLVDNGGSGVFGKSNTIHLDSGAENPGEGVNSLPETKEEKPAEDSVVEEVKQTSSGTVSIKLQDETFIEVTVEDQDLNLNSNAADTVAVQAVNDNGELLEVILTETGADTNVFVGTVMLNLSAEKSEEMLTITDGDTVTITYTDEANAEGKKIEAAQSITIQFGKTK